MYPLTSSQGPLRMAARDHAEVEHIFVSVFSSANWLFTSFANFSIGLFVFFLLIFRSDVYVENRAF